MKKTDTSLLSENMGDDVETAKKNTWLIDSGASTHISNSLEEMKNLRKIERKIKIGSGEHVTTIHIGDLFGNIVSKKGKISVFVSRKYWWYRVCTVILLV